MFLDLRDVVITALPVVLDADSDQWELINQEVDELLRTINSCLLKHQSVSSSTTRSAADNPIAQIICCCLQQISRCARAQSAADADNPIVQIIRCKPQQLSRRARAQSAEGYFQRAVGSELSDSLPETSLPYLRAGEPCEPELNKAAGQGSLERTTPPTIHSNVRSTEDRRIAPIENACPKRSDIKYEWDDKVLLLRPSAAQWSDLPAL